MGNKTSTATDPWVKTGLLRLEVCSVPSQAAADGPLAVCGFAVDISAGHDPLVAVE